MDNPQFPMTFAHGGKTYIYDFNLLCVEQAEFAREAGEFKLNQSQLEPESFRQLLKSRGAEWLSIIMSYLLLEVKKDKTLPYDRGTAETDIEQFVKSLPASEIPRLKECVRDFFTNTGADQMSSALLQKTGKHNLMQMLLPILTRLKSEGK